MKTYQDGDRVFAHTELFERIVAENGGVLYRPATGEYVPLSAPPPARFLELLRQRGVQPLDLGRVIVATHEPQESVVLQVIRELGLELQLIFNKGAVMVLPPGVNKASGLKEALTELGLSPQKVVAVGDAENDHALLDLCGFSAAVANALPALQEHADWVSGSENGAGVVELIDEMLNDNLGPVNFDPPNVS
jgi:hydroxymethylpyrimidine pyrophosphatase-like HAD family hydrolase